MYLEYCHNSWCEEMQGHGSDGDECGFSSFTPRSESDVGLYDGVSSKTLSAALLFSHSGSHVSDFAPLKYGAESEAVFAITPDLRCYFDVLADASSVSLRVVHRSFGSVVVW